MNSIGKVQEIVFNIIDRLVVIGNQVAVDVVAVVRRLLGRRIVVKVPQLRGRIVGPVVYTLQPLTEAIVFIRIICLPAFEHCAASVATLPSSFIYLLSK
jgi:hypothetical protein